MCSVQVVGHLLLEISIISRVGIQQVCYFLLVQHWILWVICMLPIMITIAGITRVSGNNITTFNGPWALALDSQLSLYVADLSNHRIQKFLRY